MRSRPETIMNNTIVAIGALLMAGIFVCLIMLLSGKAQALEITAPATLTWIPPTTYANESNTPMPASDLGIYRIYWGLSPTTMTNVVTVPGTATSYSWSEKIDVPVNGLRPVYYAITASSASSGKESARSVAVKKEFSLSVDAAPAIPAGLSVGAGNCVAPAGFTCKMIP